MSHWTMGVTTARKSSRPPQNRLTLWVFPSGLRLWQRDTSKPTATTPRIQFRTLSIMSWPPRWCR